MTTRPNTRTRLWLAFRCEHQDLSRWSEAQIWNDGFDAGWYARIAREKELEILTNNEPPVTEENE